MTPQFMAAISLPTGTSWNMVVSRAKVGISSYRIPGALGLTSWAAVLPGL